MDSENKLNDAVINALSMLQRVHRLSGTIAILDGELIHANISQMKAFSSGLFTEAVQSIFDGFAQRRRRAERVTFIFGGQNVLLVSGGPMIIGFFFDKLSDLESVEAGIDNFIKQFGSALHMDKPAPEVAEVPLDQPKKIVQPKPPTTVVKTSMLPKIDAAEPEAEEITEVAPDVRNPVSEPTTEQTPEYFTDPLSRFLLSGLFAAGGFLGFGTFFLFPDAGFWSGEATGETVGVISWWAGLAALLTIIPIGGASRLKWGGIAMFSVLNGALILPILARWLIEGGWLNLMGHVSPIGATLITAGAGAVALALGIAARSAETSTPTFSPPIYSALCIASLGVLYFGGGEVPVVPPIQIAISALTAGIVSFIVFRTSTRSLSIEFVLGGAVAAIAGGGELTPLHCVITGGVAGLIGAVCSILLRRTSIADEAGFIPAFLICGLSGTVFAAIVGVVSWKSQLAGFGAIALAAGAAAFCIFQFLKLCGLLTEPES